ncbi:hypothetical protein [Salmonirosea aquatica]|uniref:Glycosyl transferase n=1 Tax=Salmonirosea aquatica TaxID=2654236 RepID=A0A7C9FBI8_9BACT|nr:hypothetical protein [Cytophagaceae bacterium SJW1-29]
MKIVFTVCNRHQLRQALTLGESLLLHNPDYLFVIGWMDEAPLVNLPEWVRVIRFHELEVPDAKAMCLRYYDFELNAACKPFFARKILEIYPRCTRLMYLAPSIWVLDSLESVLNSKYFLQITPHRLHPIVPGSHLDDKAILNIGMYHAGSWVLHPDGQENKLLDWWCERTMDRAYFNLCEGMCMDQLWMNYLPLLYSNVQAVRRPSWHFGLHAQVDQNLEQDKEGTFWVKQHSLISIDFAGIEVYHPIWTDHANLISRKAPWQEICRLYQERVIAQKVHSFESGSNPYGRASIIKPFRKQRKQVIGLLETLVNRIETYDLTHN